MRGNCLVLDYVIVEPMLEYGYLHSQSFEEKKRNHCWPQLLFYAQKLLLETRIQVATISYRSNTFCTEGQNKQSFYWLLIHKTVGLIFFHYAIQIIILPYSSIIEEKCVSRQTAFEHTSGTALRGPLKVLISTLMLIK